MSNYQETNVSGTEYRRSRLVQIVNERNKTPHITFVEELVTIIGSNTLSRDVASLSDVYDPNGTIELLDPETGLSTNQLISHALIYQALYSLYMKLATDRDTMEEQALLQQQQQQQLTQGTTSTGEPVYE